jgi:type II secretory pathway component PulC
MRDNISPEEKLLRLIKGKKEQRPKEQTSLSYPALSSSKQQDRPGAIKNLQPHYFLNSQMAIMLFLAIAFIYFLFSFIYPFFNLNRIHLAEIKQQDIKTGALETAQSLKPYEFYAEAIKQHQMFGGPYDSGTESPVNIATKEIIKDISLVGVIAGESPQAIIEDKKAQKTYYVTEGQYIGDIQIIDIQEGKIILLYKGERFELYL